MASQQVHRNKRLNITRLVISGWPELIVSRLTAVPRCSCMGKPEPLAHAGLNDGPARSGEEVPAGRGHRWQRTGGGGTALCLGVSRLLDQ
jgi:hypothetical protein